MIRHLLMVIMIASFAIIPHENSTSRADFFKDQLRADDNLLVTIETIDNEFRVKYNRLRSELKFRNTELDELVKKKPFDEIETKKILKKIAEADAQMKLYSIQHHLAIEEKLDSYQRMKFNEFFKP